MATVDELVASNVLPEFQDVVTMLRSLMRECAPEATERMYYGLPMWVGKQTPLAWISPTRHGITFGREFDDPYDLLTGDGKHARHVKVSSVEGVDREALRSYVQQALARDEQ
jgi:uncharacterized protein YdhG (YjbR/CyaY superfamily)